MRDRSTDDAAKPAQNGMDSVSLGLSVLALLIAIVGIRHLPPAVIVASSVSAGACIIFGIIRSPTLKQTIPIAILAGVAAYIGYFLVWPQTGFKGVLGAVEESPNSPDSPGKAHTVSEPATLMKKGSERPSTTVPRNGLQRQSDVPSAPAQPSMSVSARSGYDTFSNAQGRGNYTDKNGGLAAGPSTEAFPPSSASEPRPGKPATFRLADVIAFDVATVPDGSLQFPLDHFRDSINDELSEYSTSISKLRVSAAFVEPREYRYEATGGQTIGYVIVFLPDVEGCHRQFGPAQSYNFATPQVGMVRAIDDRAKDVAMWIESATSGGVLKCPS